MTLVSLGVKHKQPPSFVLSEICQTNKEMDAKLVKLGKMADADCYFYP